MTAAKTPGHISEHILEIRYKANPKILDYRGTWAELISKYMDLAHWQIIENRIDIFDLERKNRAFVGFKNSGFITRNSPTADYFPNQARKLFSYLFDELKGFDKKPFIERIGVRSKIVTSFPESFEVLVKRYNSRYLQLTPEAESIINAELVDIGGPLNFKDSYGNFNTMSGPMPKQQMGGFFRSNDKDNFPDVGLYVDIDYWQKPQKEIPHKEILKLIRTLAEQAQRRHEQVRNLILED